MNQIDEPELISGDSLGYTTHTGKSCETRFYTPQIAMTFECTSTYIWTITYNSVKMNKCYLV